MCCSTRENLTGRKRLWLSSICLGIIAMLPGCSDDETVPVPGLPGVVKSSAAVRALRRAYDGAPPVIPHDPFGLSCITCHNERGMAVEGTGFAPPSPHGELTGGSLSRCQQCHVFATTEGVFVESGFTGLKQDLSPGERPHYLAPPVIPHQLLMRENCAACHTSPAAREEIRCTHPERVRCAQCHVEATTTVEFVRGNRG